MNDAWRRHNGWAIELAEARDERLVTEPPPEKLSMTGLLVWTKKQLHDVAARDVNVHSLVQISARTQRERALTCGRRDGPFFVRSDGVRCHFIIDVREVGKELRLLSYVMHLDAPEGHPAAPSFLRWEYQRERRPGVDAVKEPLAHLHPGHDHVRVPAPVLSPKELITVFLGVELWR